MCKGLSAFLALVLVLVLAGQAVRGAGIDPERAVSSLPERGDQVPDYLMTQASRVLQPTIYSPYDAVIGTTWYDNQHSARIPRMNANDYQTSRGLHFTFMEMEEPPGERYVSYTYWDRLGWTILPADGISVATGRGGYTGLDLIRPLNSAVHSRAVVCHHYTQPIYPDPQQCMTVLAIEPHLPGQIAMFGGQYWYDIPDAVQGSDWHGLWPACGVDSLNRIHVIMHEGKTSAGPGWIAYTRCEELPGDSVKCCAPGKGCVRLAKETYYTHLDYEVAVVGTSNVIGGVVATSKISNKVALLWPSAAETLVDSGVGTMQNCNDIFYIESATGGDDWQVAGAMPPRINITRYQPDDPYRSYGELSALYDFYDSLHVFWIGQGYDQTNNKIFPDDVTLWHWSKAAVRYCGGDTLLHNRIAEALWGVFPGAGAWNRTIAKVQSGVGIIDSTIDPDHYNGNHLYVQWVQFDDPEEDPALWNESESFLQGDIYITVSTDHGFTWQDPVNVTNSAVDHCASGHCASDHWSSMAERVDTCVYMQWIYDLDAGAMVQWEGVMTNNPVLFRAFPVDSIPADTVARIAWNPKSFVDPVIHVPLNAVDTVRVLIENIGTKSMNVTDISSGAEGDWLTIDPKSATIPPGGCPVNLKLIIAGGTQEEFLEDSVRIQSNDEAGNNNVYIPMNVVFSDEYVQPEFIVVSNPTYRLSVSNSGNLGRQNDTAGFYMHQDYYKPNLLLDGSPLTGFISPNNDTLVGRYMYDDHFLLPATHLTVDSFPELKTIVAESEFWPVRINTPPADQYWPWWRIRMKGYIFDSWEGSGSGTENKNEQHMALKVLQVFHDEPPAWWVEVSPPASIPETYLGMALDIQCPSDSNAWNYPFVDSTRRMAYLQGYGGINENYRMGIAQKDTCYEFESGKLACWPSTANDQPFAMHILRTDTFLYPPPVFNDSSFYRWMSISGYSISGSGEPMGYMIITTGRKIPAHSYPSDDILEVRYALLTSDQSDVANLDTLVDMIMCGNVDRNLTVDVADVVYYINYLFKGGPGIWNFMGDVNGDGFAELSDVVYLISYVLQSGPPARCDCLK